MTEANPSQKHRFSIYLLEEDCKPEKAIKNGKLSKCKDPPLPEGSQLYYSSRQADDPWWAEELGIVIEPSRINSALAFIEAGGRCFALAFGHAHLYLDEDCCEDDFGLYVARNSVAHDKLRTCDIFVPGTALRMRAQAPGYTHLDSFGLDQRDNLWRGFAGLTNEEHTKIFSHVSSNRNCLRCTTDIKLDKLDELLEILLKCYESKDYKQYFSSMDKIKPVRKSSGEEKLLYRKLEKALEEKSLEVMLTIPGIFDDASFEKAYLNDRKTMAQDDVSINLYYDYVHKHGQKKFKACENAHSLTLAPVEGRPRKFSLYKCFVFETTLEGKKFILNEGRWHHVDNSLASQVNDLLGKYHKELVNLPNYEGKEPEYNKKAANKCGYLCLDGKNILKPPEDRPKDKLEPCDLFTETSGDTPTLVHVKNPKYARDYSHLFNQGLNSARSILSEKSSRINMNKLIKNGYNKIDPRKRLRVVYAIAVTSKKRDEGFPIPFFSQLSLYTVIQECRITNIDVSFQFIEKHE